MAKRADANKHLSIRGRIQHQVPLAPLTWLGVGGPAEVLFVPADEDDLIQFLMQSKGVTPILFGAGSNMLVRDGGIPGVTIRLTRGFRSFRVQGHEVTIGAGLPDRIIAERCQALGLSGMEFLHTIPGTLGGGIRMNAGSFGGEVADRLICAWALDPTGKKHTLTPKELGFGYRHCSLPQDWIFLGGKFLLTPSDPKTVYNVMQKYVQQREATQPLHVKTGGSTFMNPRDHKAWQLIDQIGYRGHCHGGAKVSEKHCNFLINHNNATAKDFEELGEDIRAKVLQQTGVHLHWEIMRVGIE